MQISIIKTNPEKLPLISELEPGQVFKMSKESGGIWMKAKENKSAFTKINLDGCAILNLNSFTLGTLKDSRVYPINAILTEIF